MEIRALVYFSAVTLSSGAINHEVQPCWKA